MSEFLCLCKTLTPQVRRVSSMPHRVEAEVIGDRGITLNVDVHCGRYVLSQDNVGP